MFSVAELERGGKGRGSHSRVVPAVLNVRKLESLVTIIQVGQPSARDFNSSSLFPDLEQKTSFRKDQLQLHTEFRTANLKTGGPGSYKYTFGKDGALRPGKWY